MMERRKQMAQQRGRTPNDVVAVCKAYSERLKDKPVRVKLHVSSGRLADGTVSLESVDGAPAQLVVQAQGSNLFGLVKREIRHVFKVGELERSRSTHTAFLLRSIKHLAKGNEAKKEEILARSLSLVRKNEAVDLTFATENECSKLGDWIDAKWSVAMIQKSFRGNPRLSLALEGKNKTLNDQGFYDALDKSVDNNSARKGKRRGMRGRWRRGGSDEVDGAGFARLATLDAAAKSKLQDDLLDGVHVTYHDLSLRGFLSTSSPRRLRFDYKSKAGLVYLEPSFEGVGQTLVQPISSLIQVGGGPSAHGPTSSLLRATGDNKEQRATAVSLVFSERSMDITCGSEKDAVELVLFFSELKGFTRAKPPDRHMLCVSPASEAGGGIDHPAPDRQTKEATRDLGVHRGSGGGAGGHRGEPPVAGAIYNVGAAMLNAVSATEALDVDDALGQSAPPTLAAKAEAAEAEAKSPAASGATDALGTSAPSFSTRFRTGYGKGGVEALLEKQLSAASGFHASESLRKMAAAPPAAGGGVAQQRVWATHRGAATSSATSAFTAESIATGAPVFHTTPSPAQRSTMGAALDSEERSGRGQPQRRRAEGTGEKGEQEGSRGRQHQDHARQRASGMEPPPPYRSPPRYGETPPINDEASSAGAGAGGSGGVFAALAHQDRRHEAALGAAPRRHGQAASTEPMAAADYQLSPTSRSRSPASRSKSPAPRSKSPVSRSRSPASRKVPKEAVAGHRNTLGDTTGGVGIVSHPRGPPLPARDGRGAGVGGGGGDSDVHERDHQKHRGNLHAVFPGRPRGPAATSVPPLPARGGVSAGGDGATGGAAGGPDGHHRARLHPQLPGRARGPAATSSAAATAAGREEGRNGAPSRSGPSPARQPAPFASAAEMLASTSVAEPAASTTGSDVERSGKGHGHGRGRRHTSPAGGRPGLGDLEDDENYTTVRVKGTTPSPTSSDIERSGYGRRRATAPAMDRSGRSGDDSADQRRSSTPTKDRHRKSGGLTKALLRGKLFASSQGAQGSPGSGTPSSTSISPVPARGSGGVGRGFGSSLETSSSSSGSARTRVAAFLTKSSMTSVGGVEGFETSPSPTKAHGSRFRSAPGPPATVNRARPASQASSEVTRHGRSRSPVP